MPNFYLSFFYMYFTSVQEIKVYAIWFHMNI